MIGLLQRVSQAAVTVNGKTTGTIGRGVLVFVGVECGDDEAKADRLLERLLGYRVFPDTEGKMNRSVQDIAGGLLLVPQFTLAADTQRGCARVSHRQRHRRRGSGYLAICSRRRGGNTPRWKAESSALTCR